MSTPTSACLLTTSSTPRCIATSNAACSKCSPRSCVKRKSTTSCDRGRLPTCDVRIRSVLVFILSLRSWSLVASLCFGALGFGRLWVLGLAVMRHQPKEYRPETKDPSDSFQLGAHHARAVDHRL